MKTSLWSLCCVLLTVDALHGAGFPIRRADSSWGGFSAGLIDGNAFLAAGEAHGSAAESKIAFIGKWDLDGNPIWEKSTREWADTYRSIRKNPDGTYLILGDTYPLPAVGPGLSGPLALILDDSGNTLSRTHVSIPRSSYLDFAMVQGRNFILGTDYYYPEEPFLAEVDTQYRLLRTVSLATSDPDFVAARLLPWNGKLVVMGGSGRYGAHPSGTRSLKPAILVVGLDGVIERIIDTLDDAGTGGYLTDGMMAGDRFLISGPMLVAQLGPELNVEWKRRLGPDAMAAPTLLRRDADGNLFAFRHTSRVEPVLGLGISTFDSRGNPLQNGVFRNDFAGDDFLMVPDGRILALGLGNDNLPRNVDEAARIYSFSSAPYLAPPVTIGKRTRSLKQPAIPPSGTWDALGRCADEPGGIRLQPFSATRN